jgi:alpha/beta superfamily hydrolase
VPGSGLADRNTNGPKLRLNINRDIAHALAQRGIASLRYDKRGVGESPGSRLDTDLPTDQRDATAALHWLTGSAEVPTFLVGYGEGAVVAQLLAAEHRELAGIVLLAAPARPKADTTAWQMREVEKRIPRLPRPISQLLLI